MHRRRTDTISPAAGKGGIAHASSRRSAAVLERDVLTGVADGLRRPVSSTPPASWRWRACSPRMSAGNFVLIGERLATGTGSVVAKLAALPIFVLAVGGARLVALAMEPPEDRR